MTTTIKRRIPIQIKSVSRQTIMIKSQSKEANTSNIVPRVVNIKKPHENRGI